jgi:hypothetical protein
MAHIPSTTSVAPVIFETMSGLSPLVYPLIVAMVGAGVAMFCINRLVGQNKFIAITTDKESGNSVPLLATLIPENNIVTLEAIPEDLTKDVNDAISYVEDTRNINIVKDQTADTYIDIPLIDVKEPTQETKDIIEESNKLIEFGLPEADYVMVNQHEEKDQSNSNSDEEPEIIESPIRKPEVLDVEILQPHLENQTITTKFDSDTIPLVVNNSPQTESVSSTSSTSTYPPSTTSTEGEHLNNSYFPLNVIKSIFFPTLNKRQKSPVYIVNNGKLSKDEIFM